ncbi:MAG: polyribonucleotide nucleotidyltransferase [Rickettsiales bacterium]|jgi:polyribonucleotide nucleotidyltransferase|nr:polyribonucleotide nucleotidyltransferase [Rickettsiales bacterium]
MLFGLFGKKDEQAGITGELNHPISVSLQYGGDTLTLETGRFAKQATGSVMATLGGTMVLATVVGERTAVEGQDFFPLTVDYQEKFASAGRIPGSRDRREGRASNAETLIARMIDRPLRPLFPETFKNKVQIIAQCFSYDKVNQPDIVAMIASSAALAISGIPFSGPIGAARVGYNDGNYVLNPSKKVAEDSEMDMVVAATKDGVLMVESEIGELDEKTTLGAVKFGFDAQQAVIKAINELKEKAGKPDWAVVEKSAEYIALEKDFESFAGEIEAALGIKEKLLRLDTLSEIHSKAKARIAEVLPETKTASSTLNSWADEVVEAITARIMRGNILAGKPRIDGRDNKTVRPIEIELGVMPRAHGSALFTRGETQALVSLTLGGGKDALPLEFMEGAIEQDFILNYNFPGYSVGEAKMLKGPGRREIGHGNLAWRALHPMMPARSEFDYVVRIVSDILESNGSSSMATTCGATLAMMDGGVPLKRPVAGIAMGLIKEGSDYAVLTDILGDEDHLGDMDFKVCGTGEGITALQMDIKITSITFEIMEKALAQAKDGRMHILGKIEKAIKNPRKEVSEFAPQAYSMKINPDKIREVIGKGGAIIQALTRDTGTQIDLSDDGSIKIMATSKEQADDAIARIKAIVAEPEVGEIYEGVVSGMKDFGLFVKIAGNFEAMVHISEITGERIAKIEDAKIKEGDKVFVRYLGADKRGKTRFSMVGIDQKTGAEVKK